MPENDAFLLAARVRWMRVIGFGIYVLAFFLPAVRDKPTDAVAFSSPTVYKGWFCAFVTIMNTFSADAWSSSSFLAVLSGWINPLILIYLILLVRTSYVWPRRIIAIAIVAFMIATWIYFAISSMVPLIGHVLWIAGALMILTGEVVRLSTPQVKNDHVQTTTVSL